MPNRSSTEGRDPARKGTILVVDDDRLVLATLAHGLAQAGYDVIDADNGDDAIALAQARRPDLALLDIRMEGKSGLDVAAYLRTHCGIPFVFLSAFSDAQTIAEVRALGAVAYLVKPLDIGQIVPTVEAAFARGAPRPAAGDMPADTLAMAVGVLMQRHALGRQAAWQRLCGAAEAVGCTPADEAERLLCALEACAPGGARD